MGFCHPFHNLLMTLVGCFTTHLWVDLWYQRVSVPSQFLAVLLWITTVGPLSIILDPPTAVDFSLGDKLTVTVFSVLLVQLLSSASSVQLGFFFFFFTVSYLPLPMEKEMATHSSILAWKSHEQRSLVGYSPWGCKGSVTTEQLHFLSFFLPSPSHVYLLLSCLCGRSYAGEHFLTFLGRSRSQFCNSLDPELSEVSCSSIRNRVFFCVLFTYK